MLNLNSLAASPCVISFFLVFFNATSRSLSTWVISSCPSCIPKAWGCQDDISTLLKDDILILLPHDLTRSDILFTWLNPRPHDGDFFSWARVGLPPHFGGTLPRGVENHRFMQQVFAPSERV